MKEYLNSLGLFQSVQPSQIEEAKEKAEELNALMFNDSYQGRNIIGVVFCKAPEHIEKEIGTEWCVLFVLDQLPNKVK